MKVFRHPLCRPVSTRYLRIVLAACMLTIALFFIVPEATSQVHAQESYIIHVVVAGDNLTTIASRYNVSLSTLMAYNGISNANLIRPGQQIRIPTTTVQPAPTNTSVPTSTPAAISTPVPSTGRGDTSPVTAIPVSPSASDSTAEAETATQTPVSTTATRPGGGGPSGYTTAGEPVYTVRRGDTISGIASQYGVTVAGIMQRNGLGSYTIVVGQRLIIPIGTTVPTPTRTYQSPTRAAERSTAQPTVTPTVPSTASSRAQPTSTRSTYSSFLITATPTPRLR